MTAYEVAGRQVHTPVRIRDASAFAAGYAVRADVAQALVSAGCATDGDLEIVRIAPRRALCLLVFVDYRDGDLGPYHEFGVIFLVRERAGSKAESLRERLGRTRRTIGAYVHHLPVDGEFTLAAGRGIWGFPKTMAHFDADPDAHRASLAQDGLQIAALALGPGLPMPTAAFGASIDAYCSADGPTRRVSWEMRPQSVRARPGGARLTLGTHPVADELRALGLPRRALFGTAVDHLTMSFHDAVPVGVGGGDATA